MQIGRSHRAHRSRAGGHPTRGILASLLAVLAGAHSAAAAHLPEAPERVHTELIATYPAADTVHQGEITEIRLRFSTAVQPALSTIDVVGPAGSFRDVDTLEPVAGSEARELRLTLRAPLPSGAYTIEWRTAGPDSHPIGGSFSFTVDRPAPADEPADAVVEPGEPQLTDAPLRPSGAGDPVAGPLAPGRLLVRSLFFLSILGMLGTAVFALAVVGPLARDPLLEETARTMASRTRLTAWGVAAIVLLALPLRLWRQSVDLFGEAALQPGSLTRILGTGWGGAWFLHVAMAALFVFGVLRVAADEGRGRGWFMMFAAGVGSALVPPLSGHAAATAESVRAFAILNDAAHVVAAGVWMGTLAMLVLVGLGSVRRQGAVVPAPAGGAWEGEEGVIDEEVAVEARQEPGLLPPLARMVNAFSRVALIAVGALVATGVVNAWLQVGSFGALFASPYGRTLLVKLALVAAAASLGFYNWRVVRPALVREPRAGLIRIPASVEVLLGVAVVLVTAVLVSTPPPGR